MRARHGDAVGGRRASGASREGQRVGSAPRRTAFVAATAVDPHRFGFLFPALQSDPANLVAESPDTRAHLVALGAAMQGAGATSIVPAAYTYFGQFVDHDVTLEGVTGGVDLNGPIAPLALADIASLVNTRSGALDLDSVYGPPAAHDPADDARLLLGQVTAVGGRPFGKGSDNDLPRRPRSTDADLDRAALIGDPRNDENLIVAQLHVAFLKAHNALVASGLSFDDARTSLRRHYQHIVVHDFLKRIADPAIVDDILGNGPKAFDPGAADIFLPLEFSVAAYRFGHTMVRAEYIFNVNFQPATLAQLFMFTSLSGVMGEMPTLPENWIIEWENFVDAGRPFTKAHAFDALLVEPLAHLTSTTSTELIGEMSRLAVRNLLRGYLLRLPTGQAVAATLGFTPLTDAELHAAAANDAQRAALDAGGFGDRTPLWYYVLAEAAHGGGNRLGPVGSTIVADVLIGLLRRSDDSILAMPDWAPSLPAVQPGTFTLIDLLALAGVVTTPTPTPTDGGATYIVQPGDSLWSIAATQLGDPTRWREIFDLNAEQITDPALIFSPGESHHVV